MSKSVIQKQFNFNNKTRGFSLIEVLIVILIISILVVAAFPQIQQTLRLYRVESAAGILLNRLTEARLTAIKNNRTSWLEINSTDRTLEIWTTNQNNQPIRTQFTVPVSEDVMIVSGSPNRVTFTSLGRNQANTDVSIKLKLSKTNFCKAITISVAGSITAATC
jgi:prepilin-type N-terminal cleavage/methylation domain-containing protein